MKRKEAAMVEGKYKEWENDEGPREISFSKLNSSSAPEVENKSKIFKGMMGNRGVRIA